MSDIKIRLATLSDVPAIRQLEQRVWPNFSASEEMIASRIKTFRNGNIIAVNESNGVIVGYLVIMFIGYETEDFPHSWMEITGNGTIRNHDPKGKYMYGVTLTVDKGVDADLGDQLMIHGWCIAVQYRRRGCFLGSPIRGFASYKEKNPNASAEQYAFGRRKGKLLDPELRLYDRAGFKPVRVLKDYEPDPESLDYGVLVYCNNPFRYVPFATFIAWLIRRYGFKLLRMLWS